MAWTLGSVTLENVSQLSHRKSGNLITIPIPTQDSDQTETFDLGGNTEIIEINGRFSSDTVANTKTKADALLALQNANQAVIQLVTDITGTLNVRVKGVSMTYDVTDTPTLVIGNYNVQVIRTST